MPGMACRLALEQRPQPSAMAIVEISRERPVARLDVGHHPGKADAGIALEDLIGRQFDAAFGKAFPIGADRQQLAVDQDAVAVEDDEIPAHPASRSGFGVDDDDGDIVGRAARQHMVAQAERGIPWRRRG